MNSSKFLTTVSILIVLFLFIKIYQHNKIVKLFYDKQRIEGRKANVMKKKEKLLVELHKLEDPSFIKKVATEKFGMKDLKLSQIKIMSKA